jgi:hypothetical protein
MDFPQSTPEKIIESERRMVLTAGERYGKYTATPAHVRYFYLSASPISNMIE